MRHDVAVVGLGAMGAAALWQLARLGLDAVGIDAHSPPHDRGSTHGETRITRVGVGEGEDYVPLVRRSHAIWRELEALTGRTLFTACGALVVGRCDGFLARSIAIAQAQGVPHSLLDRAAIARRYPQFTGLDAADIAYLEPGAGFLRPEACVEVQLEQARACGARLRTGVTVVAIREEPGGVLLETDAGAIRAARCVVAAGAWTAPLLGAPFDRLLRVTRQALFWFEPEEPAAFAPDRLPAFIRVHGPGDDGFYGFPQVSDAGVKLATEVAVAIDPHRYTPGEPSAEEAAAFYEAHVEGRLAGVSRRLLRAATCLYTETADGRFLIGAHPAMPHVTVVSACSGHGFKHSAAIGELVAGRVAADLRLAPFAIG